LFCFVLYTQYIDMSHVNGHSYFQKIIQLFICILYYIMQRNSHEHHEKPT
jgi:hypothetical protein